MNATVNIDVTRKLRVKIQQARTNAGANQDFTVMDTGVKVSQSTNSN